jgi:S-methylmethionine-dependent homocysteine/selenocysteine methylase
MSPSFEALLQSQKIVLLDGATGTELQRRGIPTAPPLWTADAALHAPHVLEDIHREYLEAGADLVTANTFRSTPYTLRKLGREEEAAALTLRNVDAARRAVEKAGHGLVAGSMAPLEDCFHPERVPPGDVLLHEHAAHARNLQAAGVDVILVETMNTAREGHDAALGALATGLPVLVSFILDPQGTGDLLSGEELDVAWAHIRPLPVAGFLVNCTPPAVVTAALDQMHWSGESRPIGAYANFGHESSPGTWEPDSHTPTTAYGELAATWVRLGARLLGGCCGTTPGHIRALRRVVDDLG